MKNHKTSRKSQKSVKIPQTQQFPKSHNRAKLVHIFENYGNFGEKKYCK